MRADLDLRSDVIEMRHTGLRTYADRFNVHLLQLVECHPATLNGALRDIAELLKHVQVEQRQACFTALMDCLPHFSSAAQRWLLCNLAMRVDYYQEGIAHGGSEERGVVFAQAILDAASKQPVLGQALIVAALIEGMHIKTVARSPLASTFGEMAKRWREGPTHPEAWAALLVRGLADFLIPLDSDKNTPPAPLRFGHYHMPKFGYYRMPQFGYYRMPLPDTYDEVQSSPDTSMPGSAGVDAFALCASILQSDLAWEEKRSLLMFRDDRNSPMLHDSQEAVRMFAILENLDIDTSTFVELIEVGDVFGSTLLNRVLSSKRLIPMNGWKVDEPWLRAYAACIAASRKLPDVDKVRILRAGMRAPVAERKMHAGQPSVCVGIRFGQWEEAPFHGVSAIDSLFRDIDSYSLEAYMRVILKSPLSDDVKAQVLRLDYPDRTGQPDMLAAHRKYRDTVLASSLREDLKDWLLDGVMSDWKPGCSVM